MDPTPADPLAAPAPEACRVIHRDGQDVAVFNVAGRVYAVGSRCPHRGGPLSRGRVEEIPGRGPAVRCPIHGWLFDLATGRCLNQPSASVPVYDVP